MRKNRPPRNRKRTAKLRAKMKIARRRKQVKSIPGQRAGLTFRRGFKKK
jgi:hypothetical protein